MKKLICYVRSSLYGVTEFLLLRIKRWLSEEIKFLFSSFHNRINSFTGLFFVILSHSFPVIVPYVKVSWVRSFAI